MAESTNNTNSAAASRVKFYVTGTRFDMSKLVVPVPDEAKAEAQQEKMEASGEFFMTAITRETEEEAPAEAETVKPAIYRVVLSSESAGDKVLHIEAENATQAMFRAAAQAKADGGHGLSAREQIWDNGVISTGGIAVSVAQRMVKTGKACGEDVCVMAMRENLSKEEAQAELDAGELAKSASQSRRLEVRGKGKKARAERALWWNCEVLGWKRADAARDAIKAAKEEKPAQPASKEWTAAQCLAKSRKLANTGAKPAKRVNNGNALPGFAEACNAVEQGGEQLAMF